jgi:N-acylneuraminate cytidylyltransferase
MTRRLAIIPARGGSKRIPRKNIRDFCGKPMIAHTLQTAKESGLFDVIHVSTEDTEIFDIVSSLGFAPDFKRPMDLAQDSTPTIPVLKYVTESYVSRGRAFDEIWSLMACAPLVECVDFVDAAKLFASYKGTRSVLGVCSYAVPVEWAFDMGEGGALTPVHPGMFAKSSKDLKPRYHDAGVFAIFPAARILNAIGAGSDEGFVGHALPMTHAIDIDSEEDWLIAEAIFKVTKEQMDN